MSTETAISPESLVARIATGDREAEQALVERYSRGLMIMLKRHTRDHQEAEDFHQETFRITIERLREKPIDDPTKLAGFIHRIGKNLHIGEIRIRDRRKTAPDSESIEVAPDERGGQLSRLLRLEASATVRRLLEELRVDRDREILRRFYILEEDKVSICGALDLTSEHFDRVISRARRRFRDILESRGHPHDVLKDIVTAEDAT